MRTKIIRIKWSKPEQRDAVIKALSDDETGLYYITRKYNGKEKSLYIGESTSSIKSRLISHINWTDKYSHCEIYVRIGRITYPRTDIEKAIKHAEKALIFEHGQYGTKVLVENTASTGSYEYTDVYKIINEGDRFELKSVVDMNEHEE